MSKNTSWTPGPWFFDRTIAIQGAEELPCVVDKFRLVVAQMLDDGRSLEECEANACMIAAAPDFADIATRAQYRANELGGDYSALDPEEMASFLAELDAVLSKAEQSA